MAEVYVVEKPESAIVDHKDDHDFNLSVNQTTDGIISNVALHVADDGLDQTASCRISPTSEESIRIFVKEYVNDVIIPGAITIIENEGSSQNIVNTNQESDFNLFAKEYVIDVIIPCVIAIIENEDRSQTGSNTNHDSKLKLFAKDYVNGVIVPSSINAMGNKNTPHSTTAGNSTQGTDLKLCVKDNTNTALMTETKSSNGAKDSSTIDAIESTKPNSVFTDDPDKQSMEIDAGERIGETLTNTTIDPKRLLMLHHQLLMRQHIKERKQKVRDILEKQRKNYIDLKSAMKQATKGKFHRKEIIVDNNPNKVASSIGSKTETVSGIKSHGYTKPTAAATAIVGDITSDKFGTPVNHATEHQNNLDKPHLMSQESFNSCEILMKFFKPINQDCTDFNKPIYQDALNCSKPIPSTSDLTQYQQPELILSTEKCKNKRSRGLRFFKQTPISIYLNVMKN